MKKFIMIFFGILILLPGCVYAARIDGPYEGKVIDADTGEPVEGVVILGVWYSSQFSPAGATRNYHDAMETVTDKKGKFSIPGVGLRILSSVELGTILIFKARYSYIEIGSWGDLKNIGWKGKYEESYDPVKKLKMQERIYDPKMKVKWEDGKPIIPLRKLTAEERRRQRIPDIYLEERTEGGITHLYIPKKIKLLIKEVNKELMEQGRKPLEGE